MSMPTDNQMAEGVRRLQAGDAPGAVALLEQAAAQDPTNGSAFQYLGIARTQTGDVTGGVDALQRASELLPTSAGIWFNLGIALSREERTDAARAALERALDLEPGHTKARLALDALPSGATMPGHIPTPPYSPTPVPSPVLGPQNGFPVQGAYVPYTPAPAGGVAVRSLVEPPLGTRIARGLGWGMVYGQWWTLLNTFWILFWGGWRFGGATVVLILITMVVFTFVGALTGLICALTNAKGNLGNIIGVIAGMLLFAGEALLSGGGPGILINVFFWFATGKFVGSNIVAKIQRPVEDRP